MFQTSSGHLDHFICAVGWSVILLSHILLDTNRVESTNTFDSTGISFEIVFPDVFKSFCTGNHDKANVDLVHMPMECVINIYKGL